MAAREGIDFETALLSDSAPVLALVRALLDAVPDTHVLRDPTRGGLATALVRDRARPPGSGIRLDEARRSRCARRCAAPASCSGFDPLYVACEGRFLAIVPGEQAERALAAVRALPGRRGRATDRDGRRPRTRAGSCSRTRIGSHRLLERLSGEQLPRIC